MITHHEKEPEEKIRFVQDSPVSLIRNLKNSEGRDLWICGGAEIVRQLMQDDLIDRFYISVIPIVLGDGIRLFGKSEKRLELKLLDTRSWNGITELRYEMQKDPV
ncbi:MAG TPA: dihydrofolate reductase family protein [Candidatus Mediterraneibacter stercoravium]|uniref:Dihydrofolate reductase family protein n=1 Tax=Candidatus Mediterraneibacter stercoravium TaxID=2838685 RepID=A0A9D2GBP9_9FIRM|nr:dihydrofolate reductase family protein [Candidatus Mediterraneibacter stercoravium]